jgi:hypothetical protein
MFLNKLINMFYMKKLHHKWENFTMNKRIIVDDIIYI